jgi:hypothetical protein
MACNIQFNENALPKIVPLAISVGVAIYPGDDDSTFSKIYNLIQLTGKTTIHGAVSWKIVKIANWFLE